MSAIKTIDVNPRTVVPRGRIDTLTFGALRILWAVLLGLSASLASTAYGQTPAGFNHATTGFILEGVHMRLACEDCHKSGVPSRGLPVSCNGCHIQGGGRASTYQPPTHIPNPPNQSCRECHTQYGWTQVRMQHTLDMQGQCERCHNVQYTSAPAKSPMHLPTTANCDACHTVGAWAPTKKMVHDATSVGRCSACHNGRTAVGKAAFHVPTNAQCDVCHTSTVTFFDARYTHDPSAWGRCSQCHNGQTASGRPPAHIPTGTTQCDVCHTNHIAFTDVKMNHTGMAGKCSNCHDGSYVSQNAQTKPATHVVTSAQCDSSGCHANTTSWAGATYAHTDATKTYAGNCSSCHFPGGAGLSKPTPHVPTTQQCDSCHKSYAAFRPARMDHTGTAGQCASCHAGTYAFANAQAKSATHILTNSSCDTCHLGFVAFTPATMDHTGLAGQCSNCHSGAYLTANAQMKPATHIVTSAQCDTCHKSTVTWASATFAHDASTIGACDTCHKPGGTGLSKPTNHVPTTLQCDTCHANYVAFSPAFMNHTGTAGRCNLCHTGAYVFAGAEKQGTNHIPDTRQCDTCHSSTTVWTQRLMVHPATATGNCSSCHSGQYLSENAQMKPPTHTPTSAQCDTCHKSMTTWATVTFAHDATAVGNCANCHKAGGTGLSKPSFHVPTTKQCDTCHTNYVAFRPAQMNHTGLAGQCSSCHNATYASSNANPQGTTHIPTTAQCDGCHTSTVGWTARSMDHALVTATSCSTCHSGAYLSENAQTKSASHIPVGTTQCSTCHRGFTAFSPATMDHTGLAGQCSTCHSGGYLTANAQMKPTTHVVTSAQCDSCHKSTVTWASATFAHDANTVGVCSNCHKPGGTGLSKPTNHIPTSLQCDTCHTNFVAFKPAFMNHTGTVGQCSTCHNGSYVFAGADRQGATHIPEARQCDTCHSSTTVWTLRLMVHPANATGNCSSCHSGQYLSENAQMKPPTHTPTSAQCDTCHKSMTTWATVTFAHDGTAIGNCSNCHKAGGTGLSKPSFHVPTTKQCDSCHTNYVAFRPAQMNHTGLAGQCSSCHNATYASTNANPQGATHIPTTAQCDGCHTSTVGWAARSMNHALVSVTSCSTCHSGAYLSENAQTKSASHIPTGTIQCNACHKSFTAFSPATMDHTAVVATPCASCHGGAYVAANAQTKPATHVATTLACDSSGCHSGTVTWAGVGYAHQAADQTKCASCHTSGPGLAKPTPHIPTSAQCSVCHNMPAIGANTYSVRFKPIKTPMDHVASGASSTACSTCHNATYAFANANPQGVNHIPTSANCATCHKTGYTNWTVPLANMDHTGQTGKCSTCHSGGYLSENAQAKGATHIPTTQQCDVCHRNFLAFAPATMDHTGLTGQCSTCHSGGYLAANAQMKPVTHVATNAQCDTCHKSTVTWASATFAHDASTVGVCSNCHKAGGAGLSKPTNHIPTSLQCDTCHTNYVAFKPAFMNHTSTAGQCSICHNGSYVFAGADRQGTTHIPEARQCDTCHTSTTVWTLRLMVHPASATGNCSSCHSGQYLSENAQMKPPTHTPTIAQCDACHRSMTTWATVTFAHDATAIGVCSNCHKAGGSGLSKPANHLPTTKQCDTCHTNYVAFKPAQMNHTGLAGQCSSCHNATYAYTNANPQGTTHIPTAAQCDGCHTSTVAWTARSMNHALVSATSCTTCHSGAYLSENAQTKSASHIPTGTIQCNACHKSFTAFSPATMDHTAVVATPCASCHGGAYVAANAQTKPATHVATTLACNSSGCHTSGTVTWAGVAFAHRAADQNACTSCHTSGPGLAKPTPHIPTSAQCAFCHFMPPIGSSTYITRFSPIKTPMDHVGSGASVAVCSSCHNATYAFANANPQGVTHIPTTANCATCHKTGFTNWTVPLANMDHTGQTGKCSTCHSGGYLSENALAKPATHIPTTQQCDFCHAGGYLAWSATPRMSHTGLAGQCSTCHSGGYLSQNAQMKPAGHIPTTAQCDSCHLSTTVWTSVKHITVGVTGQCKTCHSGAYASMGAQGRPSNHIPYESQLLAGSSMSCDACHSGFVTWTSERMNHNNSQGNGSGFCIGCHLSGTSYLGSMDKKSLTHESKGKTDCSVSGCHRPLGSKGSAYTKWD